VDEHQNGSEAQARSRMEIGGHIPPPKQRSSHIGAQTSARLSSSSLLVVRRPSICTVGTGSAHSRRFTSTGNIVVLAVEGPLQKVRVASGRKLITGTLGTGHMVSGKQNRCLGRTSGFSKHLPLAPTISS
jgi:hypothetical protein